MKANNPERIRLVQIQKLRRTMAATKRRVVSQSIQRPRKGKPVAASLAQKPVKDRPKGLTNLAKKAIRVQLPEKGAFNAGLVKIPDDDRYIMVYRADEYKFIACILNSNLKVDPRSFYKFNFTNCADPRLIWMPDNKLLMVYSSTSEVGLNYECIRGSIIMDLNKSATFMNSGTFRISPEDIQTRQKNWMPFYHEDKLYLVASVSPHIIYEAVIEGGKVKSCEQRFETTWINPWIFPNDFLRGNTNAVQLEDGNYLGTFHTAVWYGSRCYYDNGCYLFEGKPPFKVLKCSNQTYIPAEAAIEPYFRNKDRILCNFPVGLVREDDKLLISYGDNDSCVKIMKTTVDQMLSLMLEVYH